MNPVREAYSFLRWRLVPTRYAGKIARTVRGRRPQAFRNSLAEQIDRSGHAAGPRIGPNMLAAIQDDFAPRIEHVVRRDHGHPFENLVHPDDLSADNPLMQFAFAPDVLDIADDYFGGRFILDSIQVLYSWPTGDRISESQMWHRDYGDSRTLHCIAYLNDVTGTEDGPFVFTDKRDTKRISRAPIIRRIHDSRFAKELDGGQVRVFTGKAGESVFVDPSVCYHYGSRCKNGRLAVFVTFFSDTPFVSPTKLVTENRHKLFEVAKAVRPDLADAYLARFLQI